MGALIFFVFCCFIYGAALDLPMQAVMSLIGGAISGFLIGRV